MPERLTRPRVGLIPTRELLLAGLRIDPDVSVPIPTTAKLAAMLAPVPELEPPTSHTAGPYGFITWPPNEL